MHDWGAGGPGEARRGRWRDRRRRRRGAASGALGERAVAGLVLGAVAGSVGPDQAVAVQRLLVDADDAVAARLEEGDDLAPACRVVPVLALARALHGDADIGLRDRAAVVGQGEAGRDLGGVDAEDVAGGAVQADMAEVDGLPDGLGQSSRRGRDQ
jgi:hypothetical protein